MGGDILRVGVEDAAEGSLGLVELPAGEIGLAEDAMGLKVLGELLEDVLRHTGRLFDLVGLEVAPGLIVRGLQAHRSHAGASCCPLQGGGGGKGLRW